jgi:hypothetical protein
MYKEIFIDFEPQGLERRGKKRMLQKTMSEGETKSDSLQPFMHSLYESD